MAGLTRKVGVYLGLVEDDVDGYDDYDEYGEYPAAPVAVPAAVPQAASGRRGRGHRDADHEVDVRHAPPGRGGSDGFDRAYPGRAAAPAPAVRSMWSDYPQPGGAPLARVTTLHPRTYNEARAIGEHFREGTPVIMNLTEMDDADAKRLVDFAAGLIFGLRGSIERVTNKVFLLSPHDVEVTAEDKQRIVEGGFFNQS
jgi:cell division inhibitor SepF